MGLKVKKYLESVEEFLDIAINGKSHLSDAYRSSRRIEDGREEFAATKTFEEAKDMAINGWKEGCDKMKDVTAQIDCVVASKKLTTQVVYDTVGACPDVGRFLQGIPDSMMSFDPVESNGSGKILSIVVNGTASGYVKCEEMIMRGAAICSLIQGFYEMGYSCEIFYVESLAGEWGVGGEGFELRFPIKKSSDPLEIDRIAFMIANPSMLRRMVFSFDETLGKEIVDYFGFNSNGGYGSPKEIPEDSDRGDIYIPIIQGGDPCWSNFKKASEWVLEQLKIKQHDNY